MILLVGARGLEPRTRGLRVRRASGRKPAHAKHSASLSHGKHGNCGIEARTRPAQASAQSHTETHEGVIKAKYGDQVPPGVEPVTVSWMPQEHSTGTGSPTNRR